MENPVISMSVSPGPLANCCVVQSIHASGSGQQTPVRSLEDVCRLAADRDMAREAIIWRAGAEAKLRDLDQDATGVRPLWEAADRWLNRGN